MWFFVQIHDKNSEVPTAVGTSDLGEKYGDSMIVIF